MAQKRMFSLAVIDTDRFQEMPLSSQALYFHLGMHGDDDGFVSSPRKIARAAGANEDDIKLLIAKGFIIPFESGVVVIRDWRINNNLRNDRYHETIYLKEKARLTCNEAGAYLLVEPVNADGNQRLTLGIPNGTERETEHSITKHNSTENTIETDKPSRSPRFVPPSIDEIRAYGEEIGSSVDPERFFDFYESKGWLVGKVKMKDWKAAFRGWGKGNNAAPSKSGHNITDPSQYD